MRKEVRAGVFGGKSHQAAEKFLRFAGKRDFRSREGARTVASQKEVQLELFPSAR